MQLSLPIRLILLSLRLVIVLGIAPITSCSALLPTKAPDKEHKQLARVPPSRNAIRFQVAFVERPVGDPMLGEALWQDVDQVGALQPQTRAALRKAGLRVGQVGSTPPMVLQNLLGYRSRDEGQVDEGQSDGPSIQPFTLQSGSDTEIQVNPNFYPRCELISDAGEQPSPRVFQNARCVLRMKAERLQDGWVRLQITPEIHHGEQRLRFAVSGANLQRRTQQEIEPLYDQAFSIDVTLGEMAVIAADDPTRKCLGTLFFVGPDEASHQRLLVIRLADMRRVDPVYAE